MMAALSETTAGWPPERRVFPIRSIELTVLAGEHPLQHHRGGRDLR